MNRRSFFATLLALPFAAKAQAKPRLVVTRRPKVSFPAHSPASPENVFFLPNRDLTTWAPSVMGYWNGVPVQLARHQHMQGGNYADAITSPGH